MKRFILVGLAIIAFSAAPAAADVNRRDAGIADLTPQVLLNPRGADYYYDRGNAFLNDKQYDRAIAEYDRAIRIAPDDVHAHIARAAAYYYTAAYTKALQDWGIVIRLTPHSAAAYGNRAWTYCQLGQPDKGLVDARRALALKAYGDGYAARACNYGARGDIRAAIEDYEKALRLSPDHSEAGDWRRALNELRGTK